ncbi:MAG: hypothetical protein KIG95_09100 [Comamonas sp.]|nr:hypothetical protein [Comamonas sp.]
MHSLQLILLIAAVALCGSGWAMIAYSGYATQRGWRGGAWYFAGFSWLQGIAYIALVGSLIFGYLAVGWWGPIAALLGGNIFTRLFLPTAKESTQLIAPIAVILLGVVCAVAWLLR